MGKEAYSGEGTAAELHRDSPVNSSEPVFVQNGLLGPVSFPQVELPIATTSEDDEEMPNVDELIQEDERNRAERLRDLKLRAVERQQQELVHDEDEDEDDSDLEIVQYSGRFERGILKSNDRISTGKKKHLTFAGASVVHDVEELSSEILERAAAPAFAARTQIAKNNDVDLKPDDLKRLLLKKAQEQAIETTRAKEEEWQRRGGKVKNSSLLSQGTAEAAKKERLSNIVAKALHSAQPPGTEFQEDEERSNGSDNDYNAEDDDYSHSDDGNRLSIDGSVFDGPESTMRRHLNEPVDDGEDEEDVVTAHTKGRTRRNVVVQSDDEDDAAANTLASPLQILAMPSPHRNFLAHRGSLSSLDERTECGTDKENDEQLKFDRGEDKENSVILSCSSSNSSFGRLPNQSLDGRFELRSSPSPLNRSRLQLSLSDAQRSPLKEIPREDDDAPILSPVPSQRFNDRLRATSDVDPFVDTGPLELSFAARPALDFTDSTQVAPANVKVFSPMKIGGLSSWGETQFLTAPQVTQYLDVSIECLLLTYMIRLQKGWII